MNAKPNGLRLMLPWPDSVLNPNVHIDPRAKIKPKRSAREAAYYLALETGVKLNPTKRYTVNLLFCPPDERSRDLDNLVASLKSALDGLSRGLGINDKMLKPVPDWGPVTERGKVEVTLLELDS